MSLPLIPFSKLPYKHWKDNQTEKKPRLTHVQHESRIFRIRQEEVESSYEKKLKERNKAGAREKRLEARRRKKGAYSGSDSDDSDGNSSGGSSDESSEYDLLDHIKELLPDEVTKPGEKPKKKANTLHLEELRAVKKKRNYFSIFQRINQSIEDFKARERERRKHHLLTHFEERVKQHDLEQKRRFEELLEQKRDEELLEEYHRQQRIERNSRKKVEKKLLAEQFSNDLERREREDHQMLFYSEFFSKWRIEEMDNKDEAARLAHERAEQERKEKAEFDEKERRRLLIEDDARLLADDEQLTRQVETIMLRSGMISYQPKLIVDDKEVVNQVFQKNKSFKQRQQSMKDEKDATMKQWREIEAERERQLLAAAAADNTTSNANTVSSSVILVTRMELVLDESSKTPEELQNLYKELKKNKMKRNARIYGYSCPFKINLAEISSTSDITHVRGRNWKEVGLFAFCYEMTQNSHFLMMTHLDLSFCYIRNIGMTQLLYHLKINNLFALQSLNFTANYLTSHITQSFLEIAKLNLFQNLRKLNLSKNELRDEGIQELIIPLIINKYVTNLEELILCQNSITNLGFEGIMKILIPLQDPCIPNIQRIALEKNLVDGPCRRQFFPIPSYISL